jgi:hypothetical protein
MWQQQIIQVLNIIIIIIIIPSNLHWMLWISLLRLQRKVRGRNESARRKPIPFRRNYRAVKLFTRRRVRGRPARQGGWLLPWWQQGGAGTGNRDWGNSRIKPCSSATQSSPKLHLFGHTPAIITWDAVDRIVRRFCLLTDKCFRTVLQRS